ncbi:ribonuclease H-like domain-containing protein [Leptodontidium sp. MPI-SDFR-AT-0119]|nr:ribonuclease H-like domain-containing protein [Leptodontidium sp. MPI-SDFR-AT-0119]
MSKNKFQRGRGRGRGDRPLSDRGLRKIENETVRAVQLKSTRPRKSILEPRLPPRPGYGTQGKEDLMLFRYSIEIIPVNTRVGRVPTSKKAKRVTELLVKKHFSKHKNNITTDYKLNLICRSELPINKEGYLVRYKSEDKDESSQNTKAYRLRLQSTGTLHFELALAAFKTISLGGGLQAIRGFFISVQFVTCRILLNVQVKHVTCYEEGLLGPLISTYLSHNDRNMVRLATFLTRVRVRVTHIIKKNRKGREIPRIKTITGLAMFGDGHGLQRPPIVPKFVTSAKEVKFHLGSPEGQPSKKGKKPIKEGPKPLGGGYISVYDFFQRNPGMPVVNVGSRQNPSYLPLDVCVVLPSQPSRAKLTLVRRPAANARSIVTNSARLLGIKPPVNPTLAEFDIAITPKLIAVLGRVLTRPNTWRDVDNYTPGLRINLNPDNIDAGIDAAFQRFVSHPTRPPPKLILAIIPHLNSSIYNRIKFMCDVKKGLLNYYANVALKFNLKLGGRNQYLDNNKIGIIAKGKTMVVGIDVTYPSPGSVSNAPSVARIATKNKGTYPENILIYRNSVSEGQYEIVLNQELPLLRQACKELYPPSNFKKGLPRISIIIVNKRHNTRFYPTIKEDADRSSNPQNSTIDFFLQAHTALQGTARPAHYHTVLNEIFRSRKAQPPFQNAADALEDLTHNICYLFSRATKAVSICPAAYYADLVYKRARYYLSKLFDTTPGPTPAGSVVSGAGGGGGQVADPNNVRIHENVRNAMFYI